MNDRMTPSGADRRNRIPDRRSLASDIAPEFEYEEKQPSPYWQLIRDVGETIILTLIMFLVIRLAVQDFQVDGVSMVPTLQDRQFVLVDKLSYLFGTPQRGDVIVFEYPRDHTLDYVKRVIGVPGDMINVSADGRISVNGVTLTEPYVSGYSNPYGPEQWTIAADTYFVLGDNRGESSDSRQWGVVHRSEIIGRAAMVYWPLSNAHFLPDEQGVYSSVPPGKSMTGITPEAAQPVDDTPLMAVVLITPFSFIIRRRIGKMSRSCASPFTSSHAHASDSP
jgi:signal peptidase I